VTAIRIYRLTKAFRAGRNVLDNVSFSVEKGEMVALIGASGSGKSTLLRHISGLISADRHADCCIVDVLGEPIQSGGRVASRAGALRPRIGFVFQQFNLVGRLPVVTNVLAGTLGRIPRWRGYVGLFSRAERRAALDALTRVGIGASAYQRASTLSGGQQQRAAIARALVQRAEIVLADEPIASLDPASARRIMENLAAINREDGITVVVSLHQVEYALRYCPRTIALEAGKVVYDGPTDALTRDFLTELYGAESGELHLDFPMPQRRPDAALVPNLAVVGS
jgi:phosphonate transport system ATP-binding protein